MNSSLFSIMDCPEANSYAQTLNAMQQATSPSDFKRLSAILDEQREVLCATPAWKDYTATFTDNDNAFAMMFGPVPTMPMKEKDDDDIRVQVWGSSEGQNCLSALTLLDWSKQRSLKNKGFSLKERIERKAAEASYTMHMETLEERKEKLFKTDAWKTYMEQFHVGKKNDEIFDLGIQ